MRHTNLPVLSIITPSYNQGRYIEQTILSVLKQEYPCVEHIVVDGGSADETVAVLKKYPHLKWISERDGGQADALNKGLKIATGDIVGWVNSDDFYEPGVFPRIREVFEDPGVGWTIGDVVNYYDGSGREAYVRSQTVTRRSLIRDPDIVRQPGTFFRSSLLRRAGGWDPKLQMVMDLDLWIRLAQITPPRMIRERTAYFRIHPDQKTQAASHTRQVNEIDQVLKRYHASAAIRFRYRTKKEYWRVKGFVKENLSHLTFRS
jgi:glycosyltransferase involved in cell wall biosynthesis